MFIVCPLHAKTDTARMRAVKAEMLRRGAPTLRGYVERGVVGDDLVLLREGTHRINAAAIIGEIPRIIPIA